ncbi:MAG: prolyl-tRNA synthetase associated domain-containing protein [Bosea sp. (in: a-proteobacteria)]
MTTTLAPTPLTPAQLLDHLAGLGIEAVTTSHEAAFTVEQSKSLTGHIAGAHTKNLFVKDKKGKLFLVVAEHERRIDLKRLHEVIGASGRLSFCNPEQMLAHLGVTPGSVTALAVIHDADHAVTVILDASLMDQDLVNCHPLINTMTTTLRREGLLAFFRATGHEPVVIVLPEPSPE